MVSAFAMLNSKLDSIGGQVFWPGSIYYLALQDAQLEVASRVNGWGYITANLNISPGDTLVTLPWQTVMIPQTLHTAEGLLVQPVPLAELDNHSSRWREEPAGPPRALVYFDWNRVRVWPKSDTSYTFTLAGVPWPTAIENTSQQSPEGVEFQEALTDIAAARIIAFTNPPLAQAYRESAERWLRQYQSRQRRQGGWNTLRLRPGTAWSLSPGGSLKHGERYR